MDTPLNPAAKGMRSVSAYLTNISYEELQRERNEVLDAQPENIKNLAVLIEAVLAQDALCVIGCRGKCRSRKRYVLRSKESILKAVGNSPAAYIRRSKYDGKF